MDSREGGGAVGVHVQIMQTLSELKTLQHPPSIVIETVSMIDGSEPSLHTSVVVPMEVLNITEDVIMVPLGVFSHPSRYTSNVVSPHVFGRALVVEQSNSREVPSGQVHSSLSFGKEHTNGATTDGQGKFLVPIK